MTRHRFVYATIASLVTSSSAVKAKEIRMTATAALGALEADRRRIVALHVTHVDDFTQTQIAITPESLSEWPSAFHHDTRDAATIADALALVEGLRPEATAEPFEVRWKLAFVDASGATVLSLFHHSREAYGFVDRSRVRFADDRILPFLHAHFGVREKSLDRL